MRTAEICPNCASYISSDCILYNGSSLSNIQVSELNSLTLILSKINALFPALSGAGIPTSVPQFYGQMYINTNNAAVYIGLSTTVPNWGLAVALSTTTTTTT